MGANDVNSASAPGGSGENDRLKRPAENEGRVSAKRKKTKKKKVTNGVLPAASGPSGSNGREGRGTQQTGTASRQPGNSLTMVSAYAMSRGQRGEDAKLAKGDNEPIRPSSGESSLNTQSIGTLQEVRAQHTPKGEQKDDSNPTEPEASGCITTSAPAENNANIAAAENTAAGSHETPTDNLVVHSSPSEEKSSKPEMPLPVTHQLDVASNVAAPADTRTLGLSEALESLLNCTICLCLPESNIYQCRNGHLLCTGCYEKVKSQDACICPICRVQMSRNNPTRNFIAEKARNSMPATCGNMGCCSTMRMENLAQHEKDECQFRKMKCRFWPIGCDWKGVAKDQAAHEAGCAIPNMTGEQVLPLVEKLHAEEGEAHEKRVNGLMGDRKVMELLESRCRTIEIRDIRLKLDEVVNDTSSMTFQALGCKWVATLWQRKADGKGEKIVGELRNGSKIERVGLKLTRQRDRARSFPFLQMSLAVLKGPSYPLPLEASVFQIVLESGSRHTPYLPLPVQDEEANQVVSCHHIHLRLIFVDCRNGMERSFTSERSQEVLEGRNVQHGEPNSDMDHEETDSDQSGSMSYSDDTDTVELYTTHRRGRRRSRSHSRSPIRIIDDASSEDFDLGDSDSSDQSDGIL